MENTKIIGVYTFCTIGSICVHEIDHTEDRVLASINGKDPEWCEMAEQMSPETDEVEEGFWFGEMFVPFSEVMRTETF